MATRLTDLTVDFGSLVDVPANQGALVVLTKRDDAAPADGVELAVAKIDEPKRHVYGWLSKVVDADGTPIVDRQGDVIDVETLEAAAKGYMLKSRATDVMHDGSAVGSVFESYVSTPEKRAAQGMDAADQSVGWWIGLECAPEVFKRVKDGELRAFSIGGSGRRETVKIGRKMAGPRLAALRAACERLTAILDEVDPTDEDEEEDMSEDTNKRDDAPVVEAPPVTDVEKQELVAKVDALTKALEAEKDARLTAEFVRKAEAFGNLSIEVGKLGTILKRISAAVPAEDYAEVERLLKAANEAASPAFAEVGQSGSTSGESATERLNKMAQGLIAEGKAGTYADAITHLAASNADLVADYRRERSRRN